MNCDIKWIDTMRFTGRSDSGHSIMFDTYSRYGGSESAPMPMEVLLMSLGSCTGMDVVSVLTKKRVKFTSFEVKIEAERADSPPRVFTSIRLIYNIGTEEKNYKAVEHAVELSQNKFCSVTAMLAKTADIEYHINLTGLSI